MAINISFPFFLGGKTAFFRKKSSFTTYIYYKLNLHFYKLNFEL